MAKTRRELLSAGDVEILEAVIISSTGNEYDFRLYITELNIFEDMFRPAMAGNIVMSDAGNLAQLVPIIGDEYVRLSISTPTMGTRGLIRRTFKVYSVTDRMMVSDTGKQTYTIHFVSPELFMDALVPVYGTFRGKVSDVARNIFDKYISASRNGGDERTELQLLGDIDHEVAFTSPGWRPMQCLNWLASRAEPMLKKNPGFLFYESSKKFYFANYEVIIDYSVRDRTIYQTYTYTPRMLNPGQDATQGYQPNIEADYGKVEDFRAIQGFNALKNVQNGYYANRLITADLLTKEYRVTDYDHIDSYRDYVHLENIRGTPNDKCAPFYPNPLRSSAGMVNFYPIHSQHFTDVKDNVQNRIRQVLPRRISNLLELTNHKIEITVPGRCDIEVGAIINFLYPDASPRDAKDKNKVPDDELYSGFYLVTAIRHKITLNKHMMILECVKDSLKRRPGT